MTALPVRAGGIEILVEASPVAGTEETPALDKAADRTIDVFERAKQTIIGLASATVETIGTMAERAVRPDHVEIAFGLKISASGGVIVIAGVSAEEFRRHCPGRLPTSPAY